MDSPTTPKDSYLWGFDTASLEVSHPMARKMSGPPWPMAIMTVPVSTGSGDIVTSNHEPGLDKSKGVPTNNPGFRLIALCKEF